MFVEFVGGPEQGFLRCFADVTYGGLNCVCNVDWKYCMTYSCFVSAIVGRTLIQC